MNRCDATTPPAVGWTVLGGVLGFLGLVTYFGWRLEQATKSIVGISEVVQRVATAEYDGPIPRGKDSIGL